MHSSNDINPYDVLPTRLHETVRGEKEPADNVVAPSFGGVDKVILRSLGEYRAEALRLGNAALDAQKRCARVVQLLEEIGLEIEDPDLKTDIAARVADVDNIRRLLEEARGVKP